MLPNPPAAPLPEGLRGSWRGWVLLLTATFTVVAAPAFLGRRAVHRIPFNEEPLRELARLRPDCVLLGDSMLGTRVSEERLNELASFRCAVMDRSGTATAIWYLMLENFIAPLRKPPREVVIFFRDRQLTLPKFRALGSYAHGFDEYRREREPLVDRLVHPPEGIAGRALALLPESWRNIIEINRGFGYTLGWSERLSLTAWPVQERRMALSHRVSEAAFRIASAGRRGRGLRDAVHELFSPGRTRRGTAALPEDGSLELDPDGPPFSEAVEQSFLPSMLALTQSREIKLIFVRVRRRNEVGPEYRGDRPELASYMKELRTWLTAHGAGLIDETQDPAITLDFFSADDHVVDEKKTEFTELFWRELQPLVSAADGKAAP